ncbi:MAG: sigma-70 family RNA polymerase sigma factor [Propionibacteriaceae bacterium]|jgi:RNA polymerase sigma factor (sigma-70 family)|nr:sigma-70 family RNA polymerase sigma factor [Propionibacteriaceae bacterium]
MDTTHDDQILAQRIEAGILAQEALDTDQLIEGASMEELEALVHQGHEAKNDLILGHLGLVRVIAVEASRKTGFSQVDLFQDGCVGLNQAVMNYDWRKGHFGPYAAMWVRAAVRGQRAHRCLPLDTVEVPDPSVEQIMEHTLTHESLAQVLELVEPAQRAVIQLRTGWDGVPRSRKDVACDLGLSLAKVRHLEQAGFAALRSFWESAQAA